MAEKSSAPRGPSVVEIFVFMNEYSFRVEPGFAVANRGDRLEFKNLTNLPVNLTFGEGWGGEPLPIDARGTASVAVPDRPAGFYPYTAAVTIGPALALHAIGGSGPGVIIRG